MRIETTTSWVAKHDQMSQIWRRAELGRHRTHYLKLVGISVKVSGTPSFPVTTYTSDRIFYMYYDGHRLGNEDSVDRFNFHSEVRKKSGQKSRMSPGGVESPSACNQLPTIQGAGGPL
jgi:hypothetical protein